MMIFNDKFLRNKYRENSKSFTDALGRWHMNDDIFSAKLDKWFGNFNNDSDKELAFKVICRIEYYSSEKVFEELRYIGGEIKKHLQLTNKSTHNIILIVPDNFMDSAKMYAYLANKCNLDGIKALSVSNLLDFEIKNEHTLMLLNDTHGTGNQLVKDVIRKIKHKIGEHKLYVAAITICENVLEYLKFEMPNAWPISQHTPRLCKEEFTAKECERLEELGRHIYTPYPMGYGNLGLLRCYYYQTPNNSLPIIWANGANNEYEGVAIYWEPLFQYDNNKRKKKDPPEDSRMLFSNRTKLSFSDEELNTINDILKSWECSDTTIRKIAKKLKKWFENFDKSNKDLALKLFKNITYLSLSHTRTVIRELYRDVTANLWDRYGDGSRSELLLVLTGDDKESVYHYQYDFLKVWGLKINQIVTLEDLLKHPHKALNKHLIYFYHTRVHKGETFVTKIWSGETKEKNEIKEKKYFVKDLPAKSHNVLSFILSEQAEEVLNEIKKGYSNFHIFSSKKLLKNIGDVLSKEELEQLKEVYNKHGVNPRKLNESLLAVYYFRCPIETLSLLWYKRFSPLFHSEK